MIPLFNRLFVRPFYEQIAGSLLVVMLLAFGFMRPMDHEALITAALGSPLLLGLFFLLWGLYALNAITFVLARLNDPTYLFLAAFRLVSRANRWLIWSSVMLSLLVPILGYAGWMLARAVHYDQWFALSCIIGFLIGLAGVGVAAIDYRLHHPAPDRFRLPRPAFRLPYLLFFPTYWLRHEPLSLLLTKGCSGLLLIGVCRLYPTDDYDERLLLIGLLLAVLFHASVPRQLSQFEGRYLPLLDNLPYSAGRRAGLYTLLYGLIWLPELALLLRNRPDAVAVGYVVLLWLTGWGWLLLLHMATYGRAVDPNRWLAFLFAGFIVGLMAIMAGLPVVAWGLAGWGIALLYSQLRSLPLKATS
ncbi:hypothetical protein [Spirosoma rhododendri]|uniref:Uncharacterized protein n=1 Tax=Spirosoma rhododendri TaxID=2728024 RepID=A0A7L5DPN3_9BACT|nr:hypothetical protein [Spirosoma rhododendri]QJD80444.1 hypothetical protein HH216_19955 [Spirosoma rhododendri]